MYEASTLKESLFALGIIIIIFMWFHVGNCNVVAAMELESKDGSSTFSGWMEAGLTVLSGDGTSEEAVSSKIISEVKSSSWSERLSLCGASSPEEQAGSEP